MKRRRPRARTLNAAAESRARLKAAFESPAVKAELAKVAKVLASIEVHVIKNEDEPESEG